MKNLELELQKRILIVERNFNPLKIEVINNVAGDQSITLHLYKDEDTFVSYSIVGLGTLKFICNGDELTEEIAKELVNISCFLCGGDGKETCTNPDHGFIGFGSPISFLGANESRCPCCGFDPNHKMPNGLECDCCEGKGYISYNEIENKMDEHGFNDACPSALESFISSVEAKGYYWAENPFGKEEPEIIEGLGVGTIDLLVENENWKQAESRTFNPGKTLIFEIRKAA
ncbi:hypothetical protein U9K52_08645 [Chryseobacterium sp. MHB01]|uniref:hypothetical protein n=1 Tax=Chryseobacterium sp. MHB01 TaxID=3109433 RepID=UPI002B002797|nr:hypothetical protein [Chryseobacterium sp. MHB01]MEA1848975.1 hypothetical protein [Chryseobacterium sp. MHB01]